MQPFYLYGQLIAVLEQGARAQGQIPWLELYYPRGFLPWVGLREPLRNHLQSVLPFLERRGRAERYIAQLNSLANALQNSEEQPQDSASFNSFCTGYCPTTAAPSPNFPTTPRPGTRRCTPRATWMNARPSSPSATAARRRDLFQFCWDYHQGRLLTWNIAGNDPGLPPGVQLGIRDRRASQPPIPLADPAEPRIAPARPRYIPGRYPA